MALVYLHIVFTWWILMIYIYHLKNQPFFVGFIYQSHQSVMGSCCSPPPWPATAESCHQVVVPTWAYHQNLPMDRWQHNGRKWLKMHGVFSIFFSMLFFFSHLLFILLSLPKNYRDYLASLIEISFSLKAWKLLPSHPKCVLADKTYQLRSTNSETTNARKSNTMLKKGPLSGWYHDFLRWFSGGDTILKTILKE